MNQSTTRVFLTTTILVLTRCSVGCEDTGQTADNRLPVVVQDSAGITIVENDPPAPDSRLPWEFSAQPSLTIGAVDSGEADELFRVTDAIRLADGRIVIANSGSSEIRVFNPDGSHSATWGAKARARASSPTVRTPSHSGPATRSLPRTPGGPGCRSSTWTATTAATWPSTSP